MGKLFTQVIGSLSRLSAYKILGIECNGNAVKFVVE